MKSTQDNIHLSNGNINISEAVIANIAKLAAEEIEGVSKITKSVTATIADIFQKNQAQGIKVETDNNNNNVTIDLSIELNYGLNIEEVATKVQENIKNNVETMTGLDVQEVNITVSGLNVAETKLDINKA